MKGQDLEIAYPSVVMEIARRLLFCENALIRLTAEPAHEEAWIAADLVALQVRKICEMLLLGSSLAHLFGGNDNFDQRKWRPREAFNELEKINRHPLPAPIDLKVYPMPGGIKQIRPLSKPMPFELLSLIYGHCGNLMHVPSADKVLKNQVPRFDVSQFGRWVTGLKRLMAGHVLLLPEMEKILLCIWAGEADKNPDIYLMESAGPAAFETSSLPDFDLLTK